MGRNKDNPQDHEWIRVDDSAIHGRGVFAKKAIPKGTEIIEYQGKLMSHDAADDRYGDDGESGQTYLFTLNDEYIIDGNRKGNAARFINHGCEPNCEAVLHEHDGSKRSKDKIIIEAMRRIEVGEELTFDYGIVLDVPHTKRMKEKWACYCGAKTCIHTMLKDKKT